MLIRYTPAEIADIVFCRAHNPPGAPRNALQAVENLKRLGFAPRQIDPHIVVLQAVVQGAALKKLLPYEKNVELVIAVTELEHDPACYLGVRINHPLGMKLLTAIEDAAYADFLENLQERARYWPMLMIPGTEGYMPAPMGHG